MRQHGLRLKWAFYADDGCEPSYWYASDGDLRPICQHFFATDGMGEKDDRPVAWLVEDEEGVNEGGAEPALRAAEAAAERMAPG